MAMAGPCRDERKRPNGETQTMYENQRTDRRTVLKTMTAAAVGGGLLTGPASARPGRANGRRNTVGVTAMHDHDAGDHRFELSTDEVSAGWTTVEFDNQTDHTHFVYLQKVPQDAIDAAKEEGKDLLTYWIEQITDPYQVFMDWILGKEEEPPSFPSWLGEVVPSGGAGLTAGQSTSRTSVDLDPGKYQVECYVKNDSNEFHSYLGMAEMLTVTDEGSGVPEPDPTLELSLSTTDGISVPTEIRPGQHTIRVNFQDQQAYPHLLGHDVHLIHLDDETTVDDVNGWMDYSNGFGTTEDQFVSDGSEPGRFLGGVQDIWTADLPRAGYFHVNLKPGDYAWVAEVPDPKSKGLLQPFTVPHGQQTGSR